MESGARTCAAIVAFEGVSSGSRVGFGAGGIEAMILPELANLPGVHQ